MSRARPLIYCRARLRSLTTTYDVGCYTPYRVPTTVELRAIIAGPAVFMHRTHYGSLVVFLKNRYETFHPILEFLPW